MNDIKKAQSTVTELWFNNAACFIENEWISSKSSQTIEVKDPSTGHVITEIAKGNEIDIDNAVNAAKKSLENDWGSMTAPERGRILAKIGRLVMKNADLLARLEAIDVGKPFKQAQADVIALARYMEFYAGAADKVHGSTIPYLDGYTVYTLREPHGITGHIIPWNYPMQIMGRSIGAALTMGNATVLKPAEEACLSTLVFADLARQAGLPSGALNVVPGLGSEAGAALTTHPLVNHLSFTGSVAVGKTIQKSAAENIVPVTLELGGKSPQIVFEDADIDAALPFLVNAGIQNGGQTCSASSRILVQRGIYDEVLERMAAQYTTLRVSSALSDGDIGPLISAKQKDNVMGFLEMGKDLNIAAQGSIDKMVPDGGNYVAPTLFSDVDPNHVLAQEEVFGPVQVVIPFEDEAEALAIANGTRFGLVASIWTRDGSRQMRLAQKLRAGQVFINNYGAGGGVELPFGGTGLSGHGREKGFEALYGFSTTKTIAASHG